MSLFLFSRCGCPGAQTQGKEVRRSGDKEVDTEKKGLLLFILFTHVTPEPLSNA